MFLQGSVSRYGRGLCCPLSCGGNCGGTECADGGRKSSDCCGHSIVASGRTCSAAVPAPCELQAPPKAKPMPAVVWLHPYSYSTGYTPAYGQAAVHEALASAVRKQKACQTFNGR